ncbi:restriction endonuclease subunit S [Vibrio bivalvicida]|uniref:Type I restriction modification DNA specificity domain-containing protein n=1 Tax=Vibrio bivalvicida TaxID=1276888 RepID=A0A177Y4W0_9VIBR|nr:restriction endonuclease subunit S [Vibrio bivalvicida]OAJ95890.1 hypothetical protein APB76_01995 [Vibrio bivalvicida]
MDAKKFLAEFGHLVDAPNGVEQLRQMVLQLATSGGLVEPNLENNSLDDELKKALRDKKDYEKENKIRKSKKSFSKSMVNFKVPSNWKIVELDEISLYIQRGKGPKYAESSSCRVISQKCIQWSGFDLGPARFVKEDSIESYSEERFLVPGDLLWNSTGTGTVGRVNIYPELDSCHKTVADSHVTVIRLANANPRFIWCVLASPWIQQRITPEHPVPLVSGTTKQVELNTSTVKSLKIPLPNYDEQTRIVEKVDELMALCDKLEEQQKQKRQLQNQLRQTTLQALAEASSSFEIKQHWQRLQENFEKLFSTPEDVTDFKGLLLDLAVSGKLLSPEKYVKDATGAELLTDIEYLRVKWAENSFDQELKEAKTMLTKLRKQNVEPPTEKLPEHWQWATFLQVSMAVIDCHNKTAPYVEKGIHLVRTTDIRNGKMDLRNTKKITDETYDYWSRRMPPKPGDIFFTREAPMGEAAVVPKKEKVCLGQRTMLLRLFPEHINNEFLLYVIRSPSFQRRMVEAAVGMTVKHLRVGGVENLFVPVPPKSEQDLIVVILNHFFSLCEKLEQGLSNKNRVAENLASSSTAELTGINITQKEESLKVPKTELVAPVVLGKNKPNSKDDAPLAALLARQNGQMNANDLWQRFDGEIDAFYAQLKVEVAHGWIAEPETASMLEKDEE